MTKHNKRSVRRVCALLALILLFSLSSVSPSVFAAETLHISSADELRDFIKSCSIDSYSKNLTAILTDDIDLGGKSLSPVPIFYGSFDGAGHKISGFTIKTRGSEIGFFRSIESGALVKDLVLEGEVSPGGSACTVGLLAGKNSGTIYNCSVSGTVSGENDIGGLVGINHNDGKISACTLDVAVSGKLRTGGLVGLNLGVVESSTGIGAVNTNAGDGAAAPGIADISNIAGAASDSITNAVNEAISGSVPNTEDAEEEISSDISDTGGIAGRNEGAVRGCTNRAAVGYPHVGYNTGGIAGSHNGIISSCENYGVILGRKDVGGIVGQFEPDMAVTFSSSSAAELEGQIASLTSTLRSLTDVLSAAADSSLTDAESINTAVGIIEDTLKIHADVGGGELELTVDQLYGSLQIINSAADKIITQLQTFNSVAGPEMSTITSELETISAALDQADASSEASSILAQIESISTQITVISNALAGLETLSQGIAAILSDDAIIDKRTPIAALLSDYYANFDSNSVSTAIDSIASSINLITAHLRTINSKISKSSAVIINSMEIISACASRLQKAFTDFVAAASSQASIINANIDKIENLIYGYSGSAAERLEQTFDTVYVQLNTINHSLDNVIKTADATNVEIYTLLNTAIDSLGDIGRSVSSLMDPPRYSTVDVSENIEQEEKPGQISSCRNIGAVSADANVGGIAGTMALELSADPEEDYSMHDGLWVDTTALFRAIVMTSSNSAAVTAKNTCSGGAVGRCDLGAVYKTENLGAVQTSNGSYCGGIVGRSSGSIISCDSLCDLTGSDYVGGIAGLGTNLSGSRSMVRIESEGECLGAIAGDADGDIVDNAFVLEELQGIDGISYSGLAYPLPYEDFISLELINPIFSDLHTDFYVDGRLIKRLSIAYGGSIRSFEIPSISQSEDGFGAWEDFETENILRSQTVNAVYYPWITTLSSGGEHPLMLCEGKFSDKALLAIEDTTPKANLGGVNKLLATYSYGVTDASAADTGEYLFHLRCETGGDISVTLVSDLGTQLLSSRRDGSYVVFTAPAEGELIVRQSQAKKIVLAVFIILLVLILLAFFIYWQNHFPSGKKDAASKKSGNEKTGKHTAKPEKKEKAKKPQKSEKTDKKPPKPPKNQKKQKAPPARGSNEASQDDDGQKTAEKPAPVSKPPQKKEQQTQRSAARSSPEPSLTYKSTWPPKDLIDEPTPAAPEKPRLDIVIGDDGIDRKI